MESIIKNAEKQTNAEMDNIFESQIYCLNINYRMKGAKDNKFHSLHSGDKENDLFQRPFVQNFDMIKKHDAFKKVG